MTSTTHARFPGLARLRVSAEYQAVFTAGRRFSSKHFRLHAMPRTDLVGARLGVAVSKRVDKRAVGRNRLKRMAREYFRRARADLPSLDFVLLVQPGAARQPLPELRSELAALFERARSLKPAGAAGTMPPSAAAPDQPPSDS